MNDSIVKVLERLEKQSGLEKSRQIDVKPQDRMLAITKETGQFFNIFLKAKQAKNILEIGTSTGYSAIWCAEAIMNNSGKIITIENNPQKINRANKNFHDAGISDMIDIMQGDALDVLNELGTIKDFFDFVLIDADKENVLKYFELVLPMTRVGGIIAIDNMLYPEKYREHMGAVSKEIKINPNVQSVLVPIGNGEEIIVRIK